jgi:hypothetical protein
MSFRSLLLYNWNVLLKYKTSLAQPCQLLRIGKIRITSNKEDNKERNHQVEMMVDIYGLKLHLCFVYNAIGWRCFIPSL